MRYLTGYLSYVSSFHPLPRLSFAAMLEFMICQLRAQFIGDQGIWSGVLMLRDNNAPISLFQE